MPVPNLTQAQSREVNDELSKLNRSKRYELTRYQKKQIEEAQPVYIYNVSPIHEWPRMFGQLGTMVIRKKPEGALLSEPTIIPGAVPRWWDHGLGRKGCEIEDGIDIAEDICGCSKEFPQPSTNNNLTLYGVFITQQKFEDLPKREQERLLAEANDKLVVKLRNMILEADGLHIANPKWVSEIQRQALNTFNHLTGSKEERPWAPIRISVRSVDCQWCGTSNKPNVPLCHNCGKTINQELLESLEKKQAKK